MTALRITFCVAAERAERLDRFLADQLAVSRTQAGRLIADKLVTAAGRPLRASARLERGAEITVAFPPDAPPRTYAPAHANLRFVYEDEHLAVLDKPAGLVVHPGPGHWDDTLVNVLVGRGTALSGGGGAATPKPGGPGSCTASTATRRDCSSWPSPTWRTGGSPARSSGAR